MESAWHRLNRAIRTCRKCQDIVRSGSRPVCGVGSSESRVMMVGLAPGKDGADLTRIPFTRDPSGELINEMLSIAGLTREQDMFITNLVKCNPKDMRGRNRPPSKQEISNCFSHLRKELGFLKPRIVVTLGRSATELVLNTRVHRMSQFHGSRTVKDGILYFPFFHPSYVIRGAYDREKYLREFKVLGDIHHKLIDEETRLSRLDILLMLLAKTSNGKQKGLIRGKTRLQKLLFLVQHELRNRGYKAKHAFRPYIYGPYSRGLYTDIEWMRMNGLVEVRTNYEENVGLLSEFIITENGTSKLNSIINSSFHRNIADLIEAIVERFNRMNTARLVEYVHRQFPEYSMSKRQKKRKHISLKLDTYM